MLKTQKIPYGQGGGVPAGGTKHSGHAYWESFVTPFQAASSYPAPPPASSLYTQPKAYKLPSVVTKLYTTVKEKPQQVVKKAAAPPEVNSTPNLPGVPGNPLDSPPKGNLPDLLNPTPDLQDEEVFYDAPDFEYDGPSQNRRRISERRNASNLRINTLNLKESTTGLLTAIEEASPTKKAIYPSPVRNYMNDNSPEQRSYPEPSYRNPESVNILNTSEEQFNLDPNPIDVDLQQAIALSKFKASEEREIREYDKNLINRAEKLASHSKAIEEREIREALPPTRSLESLRRSFEKLPKVKEFTPTFKRKNTGTKKRVNRLGKPASERLKEGLFVSTWANRLRNPVVNVNYKETSTTSSEKSGSSSFGATHGRPY